MGRFTTPPPPLDIAARYPGLARLRKAAVRLHPRKARNLPATASKLGGVLFFNGADDWPFCEEHETSFIGMLQLSKQDVPELGFPEGKDCFQLFMCPFDHHDAYCPAFSLRWRNFSATASQYSRNPHHENPEEGYQYVPVECALHPETVVEYPQLEELPAKLGARIQKDESLGEALKDWLDDPFADWAPRHAYDSFLSAAEGTKVGGYARWVQYHEMPKCPSCGEPTTLLLTLSSWEWDGGSYHRWKPDPASRESSNLNADGGNDHDLMFGDAGSIYVGICRQCPGWPVARSFQCS